MAVKLMYYYDRFLVHFNLIMVNDVRSNDLRPDDEKA